MNLTNLQLLTSALVTERNAAHGKLNVLLQQAVCTIPASFEDGRTRQIVEFNSKCQMLVADIIDYSERLSLLRDETDEDHPINRSPCFKD